MKTCSLCRRKPRSPKQRYCLKHHAEKTRAFRKTNPLTAEQRRKLNCRSYLHVYVKRGKVTKKPCEVCGAVKVEAHHDDYEKPLKVRWLCRAHHLIVTFSKAT